MGKKCLILNLVLGLYRHHLQLSFVKKALLNYCLRHRLRLFNNKINFIFKLKFKFM